MNKLNKIFLISTLFIIGCPSDENNEGKSCVLDQQCGDGLVCEDEVCKKEEIDITTTSSSTTDLILTSTSDISTTSLDPTSTTGILPDLPNPSLPTACDKDGIVDGIEECDDLIDANCHECKKDRYIFVTSFAVSGMPFPAQVCNQASINGLFFDSGLNFKPL